MGVSGHRHAPVALHPGKRPDTHCTGSWVGPRDRLDGIRYPDVFMSKYMCVYIYRARIPDGTGKYYLQKLQGDV